MYIYILADAIVHHMITVTCMPDKMSNEKEKKRKREKEKIKGKEKGKKREKKEYNIRYGYDDGY